MPLVVLLRNRLKYALNYAEAIKIIKARTVSVDGKVRTDVTFPVGFQDVVSIPATGDLFRLVFDAKGRFLFHRIDEKEAKVSTFCLSLAFALEWAANDGR